MRRINKDYPSPILGLDFGWFLTSNNSPKNGNYYTYSSNRYINLTKSFFEKHNSIMLGKYENEFNIAYLNGKVQLKTTIKFDEIETIPKKNPKKKHGSFKNLKDFFNDNEYGQTLIWKGFKVTQNNFTYKLKENKANEVIFSVFLLLNHKIPNRKIEKIKQLIDDFLLTVSSTKSGELFQEKQKEIEQAATRAAISQVMARNTSHNIGAHVMNKLIDSIRDIELFKDVSKNLNYQSPITLGQLHSNLDDELKKKLSWYEKAENELKKEILKNEIALAQIALFNNYVKCRMDYLADISFGTPLMQTNKYAYEDLFKELDKVRLLLEHISGLDSFKYEIRFTKNGEPLTTDKDLLVAIPNDILGTQAFYNILENIIRNTAKHSDKSNHQAGTPIVFTVNFIDEKPSDANTDIEDILNGFVAVEVYDNIDVSSKIDELVLSQNNKLNENILDNNKLRSSSLGLVEMDASAAYLRKRDVGLINDDKYNIEHNDSWRNKKAYKYYLKAFKKSVKVNKNEEHYLAYRFFLLRPAVVLVVTDELKDDKTKKDALKKQGVWVVTPTDFENDLKAGKVYPHEFVLVDNNVKFVKVQVETTTNVEDGQNTKATEEIDFLEYYKTSLPIRVLNTIDNLFDLLTKSADEIEKECWKEWEDKESEVHIVNGYDENYPNKFQAVFLDHLYDENGSFLPKEKIQKYWNVKAKYIEALSSLAQSKMPDFYRINHNEHSHKKTSSENFKCYLRELNSRNLIKQKIKEAILSKVIVIDERIQNTTKELDKGGKEFMTIPFKCLYAKMGVIVPDVSLNLSENSFATIKSELEQYIEKEISRAKSTDFILIHYSILERMYNDKTLIKTKLEEWTKSINVVITSGRGIPDGLTERVRFVNLSSVITTFVDVRSKYAINYLLNSSRKSNKI
ncbi:MAG: hypothetical protein IT215_03330 [Chitinophagaceae bacterium]|nr:hypothetical protein [Chitinophagaceae bacterium]